PQPHSHRAVLPRTGAPGHGRTARDRRLCLRPARAAPRVWLLADPGTSLGRRSAGPRRRPDRRGMGQVVVTIIGNGRTFLMTREMNRTMPEDSRGIRLGELAHTRSGDKGNRSNIGVVARDVSTYAWLESRLTEAIVAEFLRPLGVGTVRRYELPRLHAFNCGIGHARAGGASRSLRLDTQGKALGVILRELRLPAPDEGSPLHREVPHS